MIVIKIAILISCICIVKTSVFIPDFAETEAVVNSGVDVENKTVTETEAVVIRGVNVENKTVTESEAAVTDGVKVEDKSVTVDQKNRPSTARPSTTRPTTRPTSAKPTTARPPSTTTTPRPPSCDLVSCDSSCRSLGYSWGVCIGYTCICYGRETSESDTTEDCNHHTTTTSTTTATPEVETTLRPPIGSCNSNYCSGSCRNQSIPTGFCSNCTCTCGNAYVTSPIIGGNAATALIILIYFAINY